jgi:hypothetical protein
MSRSRSFKNLGVGVGVRVGVGVFVYRLHSPASLHNVPLFPTSIAFLKCSDFAVCLSCRNKSFFKDMGVEDW